VGGDSLTISKEGLLRQSEETGFRPEILEKVLHLISLLNGFSAHPFLRGKLALKGGTALNLFVFQLPRCRSMSMSTTLAESMWKRCAPTVRTSGKP
jgi:hypothetical protein